MIANPGGPGLVNKKPASPGEAVVDSCVFTNAGDGTPQPEPSACLDGGKDEALVHHPYKPK